MIQAEKEMWVPPSPMRLGTCYRCIEHSTSKYVDRDFDKGIEREAEIWMQQVEVNII